MDLSDINIMANRKRLCSKGEKIQENLANESNKLIKLRVAQDTAYWDLKERLKGYETEHNRLQQNMVNLQMQHETLSVKYQEELRLRPETLNKLESTRAICEVIQEYCSNLSESLRRAKEDRERIAAAYNEASARVEATVRENKEVAHRATTQITALKDQLRQSEAMIQCASECASVARSTAEATRETAHAQVAAAEALLETLSDKLAAMQAKLQEKDHLILCLREDLARHENEARAKTERAAEQTEQLQREIESCNAALATEQARGTTISREAERLSLALADIETRNEGLICEMTQDALLLQNVEETCANQKQELETLGAKHEAALKNIDELEREKSDALVRADTVERALEEAQRALGAVEGELLVVQGALEAERGAHAAAVANATEAQKTHQEAEVAHKRALADGDVALERVLSTLGVEQEERARSDRDLTAARTDLLNTQRSLEHANEQIRTHLFNLKKKDDDLGNQMKVILELRKDKDRLNTMISDMQGTIANIQKEIARPPPPPASKGRRDPPELDDNALPAPSQPMSQSQRGCDKQTPGRDNAQTELYRFLPSDGFDDDDSLLGGHGMIKIGRPSKGDMTHVRTEAAVQRPRTFFKTKRHDKPKK